MPDWSLSRAKARLDHREKLDELTARTRFEVRLHLNEPATNGAYDELTSIFAIGTDEIKGEDQRVAEISEMLRQPE